MGDGGCLWWLFLYLNGGDSVCKHLFLVDGTEHYIDYSGYRVMRVWYRCGKCGKEILGHLYWVSFLYLRIKRGGGMGLTDKQRAFVDEYLVDLNATRAYKRVYRNCRRDESAGANASRLLGNASVVAYLRERQGELRRRCEVSQERVVEELGVIAFADVGDFENVSGRKLGDKVRALELLGRHLGLFQDRVAHEGGIEVVLSGEVRDFSE